jgi:glycosyltransferase involved in cell wall biosynthesis
MACGALVVTSADTVMAEVAGDGARLAVAGDATDLANGLRVVLAATTEERTAWSSLARARAETFTWDSCVDQHLLAYEQAVS